MNSATLTDKFNRMNVISTTIEYKGTPIKVQNGKVFARAFGTTINNHSMHWSWQEIKQLEAELGMKRAQLNGCRCGLKYDEGNPNVPHYSSLDSSRP